MLQTEYQSSAHTAQWWLVPRDWRVQVCGGDVYQPWSPEKRGTESCSDTFRSQLRLWWSLRTCHHFPSHARPRQMRQRHQHTSTLWQWGPGDTRDIVTSQPRSPCITECGSLCGGEGGWETDAAWELIWILSSQAPHVPAPSSSSPAKPAPGHTCSTFPHILTASPDPIHSNLKQTHAL